MIACLPRGICSWDYELSGAGHGAQTEMRWIGEQGGLWVDGESFAVMKDGVWSGSWRLVGNAGTEFTAQKVSAFRRTFEISGRDGRAVLRAESAFGRSMRLEGDRVNALIQPAHPFTRRAAIHGEVGDFRLAAFAFWLTALTWRRAASNNSGGGT
ncbi:hypothetical protein OKA05_24875 [Luteolibacter arcticus]|uniref:DUF1579 domain-containing protein n=1 Tax=Luteolibacter arcticus TaxID=1581411 RepID=A0ABT3GQM0_9BACT|nr:hypothetical protein [Luteolibacter arcticus]MCW1925816.1 hypothetical protein [Luteolibacter arcticus]